MTQELQQWGQGPPDLGRFINLYRHGADHGIFCKVIQGGFFRSVEGAQVAKGESIPSDLDFWCYVPEPPDWKQVQHRRAVANIEECIRGHAGELVKLEEARRQLAKEMADEVYPATSV